MLGFSGVGSISDPYHLIEHPEFAVSFYDTAGYTQVDATLVGGQSTAVIVCVGQSNICNSGNATYTPANALNHHLCICNGGCYQAKSNLLGCNTQPNGNGNWIARLADKLITAGTYTRVILVPIGIGGTVISQWAAGGIFNHRIGVCNNRLTAAGLTATHVIWHQGESDEGAGTSQADYTTGLNSVISTFRTSSFNALKTAKFFPCKVSWFNGSTSAAIQAAQAAVVDNVTIFAGADSDSLDGTNRYDNTHFNATGQDAIAGLMKTIIQAHP